MCTRVMWVALVVAACGGGGGGGKSKGLPAPDPATSTGPGPGGLLACQAAVRAIDAMTACAPTPDERELEGLMMARLRGMNSSTEPLPPDSVPFMAQHCVAMLEELGDSLRWMKCSYAFTDHERQWVEAWRTRRTGVPAGADAATREALAAVIEPRDRACACTTLACAEEHERRFESSIKPLPTSARDVDRDAGSRIIDEVQACRRRMEWAAAHAAPPTTADPAAVRDMLVRLRAEAAAEKAEAAEIAQARAEDEAEEAAIAREEAEEAAAFDGDAQGGDFEDEYADDEDAEEQAP